MAAISVAHSTFFSISSLFLHRNRVAAFTFSTSSAVSSDNLRTKKRRQSVAASAVELGGVKIAKEDVVRDDPTNNVPDTIFTKLGMQLH